MASVLSALEVGMPRKSIGLNKSRRTSVTFTVFPVLYSISFAICRIACDLPTPGGPQSITDWMYTKKVDKCDKIKDK